MKEINIYNLIVLLLIVIVGLRGIIFTFSIQAFEFIPICNPKFSLKPFIPEKSLQVLGKNEMELGIPRNIFSFAGEEVEGKVDQTSKEKSIPQGGYPFCYLFINYC
jgi:hypothetical protein